MKGITTRKTVLCTLRYACLASMVALALAGPAHAQADTAVLDYDIPAGQLAQAVNGISQRSGVQVIYDIELLNGKSAGTVKGALTLKQALEKALAGTGLTYEFNGASTVVIRRAETVEKAKSQGKTAPVIDDERVVGMPAVMVKGARTLNVDIERSIDDPQPYVIFERAEIERSGAVNLDDFFRTRLPMNASAGMQAQAGFTTGNLSNINLRGLGTNQTLILVDGRRLGRTASATVPQQADISGIPMEAVERIEVLPGTASAIYGGSATGGVINIILRRDYVGNQVTLNYDNSFDTDSAIRRIDFSSGFSLFGGRTSVLVNGSYAESNKMLIRDRDFAERHYANLQERNPALYAATLPLGAGANIRSANGSNLIMKDGTVLGSSFTSAPNGYGGIGSDGGAALLANAGRYNLDPSSSSVWGVGGAFEQISNDPHVKYLGGSVRHEFSERLQGFLEASRAENASRRSSNRVDINVALPASAPNNPFQQNVVVRTSSEALDGYFKHESVNNRFGAGLVFQLSPEWAAVADYIYTNAKTIHSDGSLYVVRNNLWSSSIANGSLDVIADLDGADFSAYVPIPYYSISPTEVVTQIPAVRLSGPIGSLPGGKPRFSFLLERQDIEFKDSVGLYALTEGSIPTGGQLGDYRASLFPERSQKIDSAYIEFTVPIVSSLNALSWLKEMELQLSGRWERYQSRSAADVAFLPPATPAAASYSRNDLQEFSPLAAVRIRPLDSLVFRASYSEGFLPPDINYLVPRTEGSLTTTFVDPKRGNSVETVTVDLTSGGNPDLKPEYSKTLSVGMIYEPQWIEGFRFSIDYINLKKDDGITRLIYQNIIDNEDILPGAVTRGGNLPDDPAGWAGRVTGLERSYVNLAKSEMEAFDFRVDYRLFTAGWGDYYFHGLATWTTKDETQLTPVAGVVDELGVNATNLEWKWNVGVDWNREAWTVGWGARYTGSYYVANPDLASSQVAFLVQGNGGRVSSQVYHDVFAKYDFSHASRDGGYLNFLKGMELQVGIRNILNKKPPYEYGGFLNNYYSTLGDPRLATYYITLRQRF